MDLLVDLDVGGRRRGYAATSEGGYILLQKRLPIGRELGVFLVELIGQVEDIQGFREGDSPLFSVYAAVGWIAEVGLIGFNHQCQVGTCWRCSIFSVPLWIGCPKCCYILIEGFEIATDTSEFVKLVIREFGSGIRIAQSVEQWFKLSRDPSSV